MKCVQNDVCKLLIFMLLLIYSTNFPFASSRCPTDDEWECDNGECINEDYKCNGAVDCKDGSDEIAENCIHLYKKCPQNAFKCLYGGCVAGVFNCNRVMDCADNSDELNCDPDPDDFVLQGECKTEDEMQCLVSKECISVDIVCNGIKDCADGSDESVEVCYRHGCGNSVGFQCGYGACIIENARCDGKIDCADGSDEAWELCNYERKKNRNVAPTTPKPTPTPTPPPTPPTNPSTQRKGCQIQNTIQTQRMSIKLHPSNETIALGTFVEDFETIHIECNNGLGLRGGRTLLCNNGRWNDDFPICINYCDAADIQGLSTRAICDPHGKYYPCKKKIPPNTLIQINCNTGYKSSESIPQQIRCLPDGTFNENRRPCDLDCGRVVSTAQGLSTGGIPTNPSRVPWNVAIYELGFEYTYICSGSIVSPRVVISAAHCFFDHSNLLKKVSLFQVIAGKALRNYTANTNDNKQVADVEDFFIPPDYRGTLNGFYNDIAFVILKTPLGYNENISAVCIPSLQEYRIDGGSYVLSNLPGVITGFGTNNRLERLNMYTLSFHECNATTRIATDKFCILNNDGAAVCRGESGGGFIQESRDLLNEYSFKLLGVISNTPGTINDCTREDSKALVAVTSMHYLPMDFVKRLFNAMKEDVSSF